jgi:hypothetical protein
MNYDIYSCEKYIDLPDSSHSSLTGSSIISEQVSHFYPEDRGAGFAETLVTTYVTTLCLA